MRLPAKPIILAVLAAIAALGGFGCTYTAYTGKDGVSLKRISLFGNQTIGKIDLTKGTMEGYASEQAAAAAAAAEGFAKGLVKP